MPALIAEFRDKKIRVQSGLSKFSVIEGADDSTIKIFSRVQREFPTDSVLKQIESSDEEGYSFYELSDQEASDIGSDLLYSWISHHEYVRNTFKVNTLILQTTIPSALRQYILEARNCFALEQNNAVISMCRTILEAAAKDLCEKKGFFEPHGENVIDINPEVFNQLIKAISEGKIKKHAINIYYREACPVVHGDKSVKADQALRVLRETTDVIQQLYSLNE